MKTILDETEIEEDRRRLFSEPWHPLWQAVWRDVFLLHYRADLDVVRAVVPGAFNMDLHDGDAWVSVLAFTMRHFRPSPNGPWWTPLCRCVPEQRFLNVRTYVRHRGERGVFSLWGWVSRPPWMPALDHPFGLPCSVADIKFEHHPATGDLQGMVQAGGEQFVYKCRLDSTRLEETARPNSLAAFTLEQRNRFYWHRNRGRMFRARHEPWIVAETDPTVLDDRLLRRAFPGQDWAKPVSAQYIAGADNVYVDWTGALPRHRHLGASAFYTMP